MVKEELQAAERRLRTPSRKSDEMRGAQKPMPVDGAKDIDVAERKDDAAHRSALEARLAILEVSHRMSVRATRHSRKAAASAAHPSHDPPFHLLPRPAIPLP